MFKNLLIYRFALFNALVALLVGKLTYDGHVVAVVSGEGMSISLTIIALFSVMLAWTSVQICRVSLGMNALKRSLEPSSLPAYDWSRPSRIRREETRSMEKLKWLSVASSILIGIGLFGTVWGFSEALSGINVDDLSSSSGTQSSIGTMIAGMRIAINTTIVGAFMWMWSEVNTRMLVTASVCMWSKARDVGA